MKTILASPVQNHNDNDGNPKKTNKQPPKNKITVKKFENKNN